MKAMKSRKSVQSLVESIHSLLGLRKHLNSNWADSVCNIIKSLPSEISPPEPDDGKRNDKNVDLDTTISKIKEEIATSTVNINQLNIQRRQVLNDFLDLKGNIRVFCRVRPILPGENFGSLRPIVDLDSRSLLLKFAENKTKIYNFDRIFHPGSSQDEVFWEVEPVIKSALDGYNACVFAYGQTGTGKTFTMEGTPDCPGMVPRAIEALFNQAADSNHTFIFSFSMLEIYMGYLKDLLVPPRTTKATEPMPPCLSIHTDSKGEIEIDNLVSIQVSDYNQAMRLYRLGCGFRSTASTNSNKSSSRSHCMIRISMTSFDATERRRETNKIWMVDLGGSERVLKTKAYGRRFEEGKAINLSLSALGDVINALQCKKRHVPFRNSRLTQVLKDSLGEDSKALMLVHVSPKEEDVCETVCSLNFATRARSIHLGKESTEAKAQKEVAVTNLLQKMKQIEDERHEVGKAIKKLNETLENLARAPKYFKEELEATHPSIEVPQSNLEAAKKIGNFISGSLPGLPRFMRSTICSRRKYGAEHQNSREKNTVPARRRRPPSHRAESVTFPIKDLSECNSDSSVSRTSCLVGLNTKCSIDNETEYSQDTSESDIKTVVFSEQYKSSRNSNPRRSDCSHSDRHENSSEKLLKVDNWLYSHKNAPRTSTRNHHKAPAIPTPEKKNRENRQRITEKLHLNKLYDYGITKKVLKYDKANELADTEDGIRTEAMTEIKVTDSKDFVSEDYRPISISPSCTSDGMVTMEARVTDKMSIEDSKCSPSTPPDMWMDRFNQEKDENGVDEIFMPAIPCDMDHLEVSMLNKSWGCSFYASDISNGATGQVEDFSVPILRTELKAESHNKVPTERSKEGEEENLHVNDKPCRAGMKLQLNKLRCQKGLLMDKANETYLTVHLAEFQGKAHYTGIYGLLKQKIKIICSSALLGLGFQSIGLGHEFFYALVL